MYKLKISLEIENDWKLLLTQKFPETRFKVLVSFLAGDGSAMNVLHARCSDKDNLKNFLNKTFQKFSVLEENQEDIFFELYTNRNFENNMFHQDKCFMLGNAVLHKGKVLYELYSSSKGSLSNLFNELQKHAKVGMLFLSKSRFPSLDLSARQSLVMELAYESGYYDFPRKANAEEVANKMGLKPSTVNEHIRKAESKIVNHFMKMKNLR